MYLVRSGGHELIHPDYFISNYAILDFGGTAKTLPLLLGVISIKLSVS